MAKFKKNHFSTDEHFKKVYIWCYDYYNLDGKGNVPFKYVMGIPIHLYNAFNLLLSTVEAVLR